MTSKNWRERAEEHRRRYVDFVDNDDRVDEAALAVASREALLTKLAVRVAEALEAYEKAAEAPDEPKGKGGVGEGGHRGFTSVRKVGTSVPRMLEPVKDDVPTFSRGVQVAKAKVKNPTPFQAALFKRNMSMTDWAAKNGADEDAVRSWNKRGKGARSIPRHWAEKIEKELGIEAKPSNWPKGIGK